jgi:CheY-like chemotaxis protein
VPVVAVTAQAMDGDRQRLLQAGFDGYLSKPIDVRSFAATVEAFVRA